MADPTPTSKVPPQDNAKTSGGLFSFVARFRFRTMIIILAACRLVRFEDVLCAVLISIYIYIISRYVFPPITSESPPSVSKGTKNFKAYVTLAAYVGFYLPFPYVMMGVYVGDKDAVQTAASHTFLLACQVVSESLSTGLSLPARTFVPILYNSCRLVSIWAWIGSDFSKGARTGPFSATHWILLGRSLAVMNLLLWIYNLFGRLVPMHLPNSFRKYFEEEKIWSQQSVKTE